MYGKVPRPHKPLHITSHVRSEDKDALGGTAVRREITISFLGSADGPRLDLLLYLPKIAGPSRRVPAFLGLNFEGNHTIHRDPGIALARGWVRNNPHTASKTTEPPSRPAGPAARGGRSSACSRAAMRWSRPTTATSTPTTTTDSRTESSLSSISPARRAPPPTSGARSPPGPGASPGRSTRSNRSPRSTRRRSWFMGHSRLGKTALWAGATDPRFAIVISNESGCGGAALSRRDFGETVARINTSFPHWFCTNFHQYNGQEDRLPVDQHELIALIAPRPVLICSAAEDLWADPKGEFLAALGASPVYKLLGTDGLAVDTMPAPATGQLTKSTIGYHIRPGKHDVTADDWDAFMNFADYHFHR